MLGTLEFGEAMLSLAEMHNWEEISGIINNKSYIASEVSDEYIDIFQNIHHNNLTIPEDQAELLAHVETIMDLIEGLARSRANYDLELLEKLDPQALRDMVAKVNYRHDSRIAG
jgi:hypothetical protein